MARAALRRSAGGADAGNFAVTSGTAFADFTNLSCAVTVDGLVSAGVPRAFEARHEIGLAHAELVWFAHQPVFFGATRMFVGPAARHAKQQRAPQEP
jgi:hypothetical protein